MSSKWLGPYVELRENPQKFKKKCILDKSLDKKVLKQFSQRKPDKLFLYSFVTNPRGLLFPVGDEFFGYQNLSYMNYWQHASTDLWEIMNEKINKVVPFIPIEEAAKTGIYSKSGLQEQRGGVVPTGVPFHDYNFGKLEERDWGGWKWFGLVVDIDKWDNTWAIFKKPDMTKKQKIAHRARPKFYKPYKLVKNNLEKMKKEFALYATPKDIDTVNPRYSFPWIDVDSKDNTSAERYEFVVQAITNKLNAKWTLAIWNAVQCRFGKLKDGISLTLRPEITFSIGRLSDEPDGKKAWGKSFAHLRQHWEGVYKLKMGLPEKLEIELVSRKKKEENPIWDGSTEKTLEILKDAYGLLLDIAAEEMNELFV